MGRLGSLHAQRDRQVGLAGTGRAEQDHILPFRDERGGRQVRDDVKYERMLSFGNAWPSLWPWPEARISIELAAIALVLSLRAGSYNTPIAELVKGIFGKAADDKINLVVRNNRLPRICTALIAGAGLVHVDKMIDAFQETFKLYW